MYIYIYLFYIFIYRIPSGQRWTWPHVRSNTTRCSRCRPQHPGVSTPAAPSAFHGFHRGHLQLTLHDLQISVAGRYLGHGFHGESWWNVVKFQEIPWFNVVIFPLRLIFLGDSFFGPCRSFAVVFLEEISELARGQMLGMDTIHAEFIG